MRCYSDVKLVLSNGKFLTRKHCAVGLGLHRLTILKESLVYLSKLAHSISYKQIEENEAAQTELALKLSRHQLIEIIRQSIALLEVSRCR